MIAPGNGLIQAVFAIAFVIASGYALGRIHQWHRDGTERDDAYRTGYDRASDCMFDMAMRKQLDESVAAGPRDAGPPVTPPSAAVEEPYSRPLVGHSRRRIAAGRLTCAVPGSAAH